MPVVGAVLLILALILALICQVVIESWPLMKEFIHARPVSPVSVPFVGDDAMAALLIWGCGVLAFALGGAFMRPFQEKSFDALLSTFAARFSFGCCAESSFSRHGAPF